MPVVAEAVPEVEERPIVRRPRSAYKKPLPLCMRTNSTVRPSREKRGDSSAHSEGGEVNRLAEPSRSTRHSDQRAAKKRGSALDRCAWATSERPLGAQATDPHERSAVRTSRFGLQSGGAATKRRLWFVATLSIPALSTSRPAHHVDRSEYRSIFATSFARPPSTETTWRVRPSAAIEADPPGSMKKKTQRSSPDQPWRMIGPGVSPGPIDV
jgi:hypothetical protein